MQKNILIVEDDLLLAHTLRKILEKHGYKTFLSSTLKKSFELAQLHSFDSVILDYQLTDGNAKSFLRFFKRYAPAVKIMMLTKKTQTTDRIAYFESGAADVLSKPCDLEEFLVRVKRLSGWKVMTQPLEELVVNNVRLDPQTATLVINHNHHPLRRREFQILEYFFLNKNRVVRQEELLKYVWGASDFPVYNTVQVYISRLRRLLDGQVQLKTVRGMGYMITTS